MERLFYLIGCACAGVAIAIACNDVPNDSSTGDTIPDVPVSVVASGVSDCWGFESAKRGERTVDPEGETLSWEFDSQSGTLDLLHAGLILNCCGVHSIEASFENGVLTLFEDDQPDPVGGRCLCICPFDFAVTLMGMKHGVITIRIVLKVDDDTTEHWTGTVDLGEGSGIISITGSAE